MIRSRALRCWLLLVPAALSWGCAQANRLSGTVTYEGQPIDKGQILFLPADGKGPSAGAAIVRGKYAMDDLAPGAKIVQVVATGEVAAPITNLEEMARKGSTPQPAPLLPASAEGNNVSIDVKPGKQVFDFHLTRPERPQIQVARP